MIWKSIDESRLDAVIVLRGITAKVPQSYERVYRPGRLMTFGTLAVCLQRVIAWSIAGTAHLLLAAVFLSLYMESQKGDDSLLTAGIWTGNKGEEGRKVEPPKPEPPVEEERKEPEKPPEPKPEPPKIEPAPVPVVKPPDPEPQPAPNAVVAAPVEDPKPLVVGAGASAPGAPARPEVTEKDIERNPTIAMRNRRAGDIDQLRQGSSKDIAVVTGAYDHVQDVLDRLEIPYTLMDPDRLPTADLSKCKILLVNCHTGYTSGLFRVTDTGTLEREIRDLELKEEALRQRILAMRDKAGVYRLGLEMLQITSRLSALRTQLENSSGVADTVGNVRRFVENGGYLFTSDWGLSLVERAFPGHVRNGGNVGPRTVPIRARPGKEKHELLQEVFFTGAKGGTGSARRLLWEIDSGSYLLRIDKPSVEILVESSDLSKYPAVAVLFRPDKAAADSKSKEPAEPGKGKVLHVLSHFKNQATKQGDYALQNLLLNFMLDRVRN